MVVVALVMGKNVVATVRQTVAATNPAQAVPGTIRGGFAVEIGRNLVHTSDSLESGEKEVVLFFQASELIEPERSSDRWIYE